MNYVVKEIYYTLQGEGANTGRAAVFCRFAGCNLWSGYEKDRQAAVCDFCDTDFVGTDGPGGGRFAAADELAAAVAAVWRSVVSCQLSVDSGRPGIAGRICPPSKQHRRSNRSLTTVDCQLSTHNGQRAPHNSLDPRTTHHSPLTTSSSGKPFVVCTGGEPLLQMDVPLVEALHANGFEVAVETNGTRPAPAGIDWICVSPKAGADLVLTSGEELKLVYPQQGAEPERFERLDFRHFFLQPMDGEHLARNTELAVRYCLHNPRWRLSLQTHKYLGLP